MDISNLCRREIISVSADASVREAALAMRTHHVGSLIVTDPEDGGRAMGVITDRDLVINLLAPGAPVDGQTIGSLCSKELVGIVATASVGDAVQAMRNAGVRRLLVVGPEGSLVGLVSSDDLFEAIAGEFEALTGALRSGLAREHVRTMPNGHAGHSGDFPRAIYLPGHEP
jgi:CBS domain-containing protein